MKKKVTISFAIIVPLLLGVIFVNSYVQALSREEKLELKKEILQKNVESNKITEEEADEIYKTIEDKMLNCNNNCNQNQYCPMYIQNNNCINQNNHYLHHNNHGCGRNYSNQQHCSKKSCNR